MASFQTFKDGYERTWANLRIRSSRKDEAQRQARRLLQGKPTYQDCEARTGVPWWFIGLCHYRESNFNFNTYLGNGQPLNRRTTIVPKGRGPFTGPNAFVDGAIDALRIQNFLGTTDWGIARTFFRLEGFNGFGYHSRGVNSPYLYGGSTAYGPPETRGGKFVRDHVFDPSVVDPQLGTAVILKELMELDSSIKFDGAVPIVMAEPDDALAHSILWLQQALNKLGADPILTEDGKNGPKTMAAVSHFQQKNGLQDTGLADVATIAAIQRKLKPAEGGPALPSTAEQPSATEQLLALILVLLEKEKSMARDFTTSGQEIDPVNALLPLLLQSMFSGKQIDVRQLIAALATGKAMPTLSLENTGVVPPSQLQPDLIAILLPILFERLTGKPFPGPTPIASTPTKPAAPPLTTVNGALGQTVGNMLNGRKTAIGAIGLLATTLLPIFFPELAPIAAVIKPAVGAAAVAAGNATNVIEPASVHAQSWGGIIMDVAQPLFAALTGWGVLGKFDKWFNRVPQ